jgi:hypothetical protein
MVKHDEDIRQIIQQFVDVMASREMVRTPPVIKVVHEIADDDQSCDVCRFWHQVPFEASECRRHAPTTRANLRRIYPETSADEWCGDFEAKP